MSAHHALSPAEQARQEAHYRRYEQNQMRPFIAALIETCSNCSPSQWKTELPVRFDQKRVEIKGRQVKN